MKKCLLFTAHWCGPCGQVKPIFDHLKHEFNSVEFSILDIEEDRELTQQCGIKSIPTMVILEDNEIKKVVVNPVNYDQMKTEILKVYGGNL